MIKSTNDTPIGRAVALCYAAAVYSEHAHGACAVDLKRLKVMNRGFLQKLYIFINNHVITHLL